MYTENTVNKNNVKLVGTSLGLEMFLFWGIVPVITEGIPSHMHPPIWEPFASDM